MFSKVFILGNLGRDPEMRYTPSGQPVCNFSVATNRVFTNGAGERVKKTTWYRATAWGKQAEICNQYLKKGRSVFIEGRLESDENGTPRVWEAQDGTHKASYEVTIQEITFIGRSETGEVEEEVPAGVDTEIPF